MKISILSTSNEHPVYPHLLRWVTLHSVVHDIELVDSKKFLSGGELLLLVSCNEIIGREIRALYRSTLVIHASDLPKGRGWSPHIWQVLEGQGEIIVSLLEAEDAVDSGAIWAQRSFVLEGHELWDEINEKLFAVELELMDFAVENFSTVTPLSQDNTKSSCYRKRTPEDSRIDPDKTIREQFNLIRVCDPHRFPAFFEIDGHIYRLIVEKIER